MKRAAEQLAQYVRDGFLLFPDWISRSALDVLRGEVERLKRIDFLALEPGEDEVLTGRIWSARQQSRS
ncbi:MAG: hypothetical protein O7H40_04930 [Gammaproteobacteria bacterium]|nr:hypothetical protein [Gammaproteobacteria bacterium]